MLANIAVVDCITGKTTVEKREIPELPHKPTPPSEVQLLFAALKAKGVITDADLEAAKNG